MVENRGSPSNRVVASGAIRCRERRSRRWVRWVIRRLPGRQVAARISTIRGLNGQCIVIVNVARRTSWYFAAVGHQLVRIREREASVGMVERRVCPHNRVVAL